MLSVSVIGGYLGAGKTTLVNHLLRNAGGARIAVLVNEFGALPIDEDLIEAQDDSLISIAGGCICCSYGNDLMEAMLNLAKLENAPDYVLIESSGVALPGAIAATVSILDGFQIDSIVALADAETILVQSKDVYVGDTIERQLADADLVLLNKADLVSDAQLQTVSKAVQALSPNAQLVTCCQAEVPNSVVLQTFARGADTAAAPRQSHAPAFATKVLPFSSECSAEDVARTLAAPQTALIRAKGFVKTPSGMRAIQVVGRRWTVSEAPKGAKPGVVVIAQAATTDLDRLERLF